MSKLSFKEDENEISAGTPVCVGDRYPWGSGAKIVRKASIKEIIAKGYEVEAESSGDKILYWVEYVKMLY